MSECVSENVGREKLTDNTHSGPSSYSLTHSLTHFLRRRTPILLPNNAPLPLPICDVLTINTLL